MLKCWGENLKYLWRSYKDFGMQNMWARSSQSCHFGKILQCWKNLGMFPSSRFWDTIFSTQFNTYVYHRVSFSAVDIIILKEEEIFSPKILMMETTISFLSEGLAVWRQKLLKNYSARKLELLSPQIRYIIHQCGIWKIMGKAIFFEKGYLSINVPVKVLEVVEAGQKLRFFKYMSTI